MGDRSCYFLLPADEDQSATCLFLFHPPPLLFIPYLKTGAFIYDVKILKYHDPLNII
jgi:hypothetical protein